MNFKTIADAVTSKTGQQLLSLRKHSPTILFAAGIVGVVGTAVLASRATLKLDDVMMGHEATADQIEESVGTLENYSEEDAKQDRVKLMLRTGTHIAKLYAPAVGVGILSIAALTGSHVILSRRNTALTLAYVAVDKAFKQYRSRVVSELGADKDLEFRHGTRTVEIVEEGPNGPETKTVTRHNPSAEPSMYAKVFDEGNENWDRHPENNLFFLRTNQQYLNDKLNRVGYVFLNDVYEQLGFKKTQAGQLVGWKKGEGDGYIDFGIWDVDNDSARDFVNGWNTRVLLDFNVDGVMYNKIEK